MGIRKEIFALLEETKRLPAPVSGSANLYTDLGFDSLSFVGFLLAVEEKYGFTLEITEMERCIQVDGLIAAVESKLAKGGE